MDVKRRRPAATTWLGLAGAALCLAQAGNAQAQAPFAGARPTAAQVAHGKAVYGDSCNTCHGDNLADGQFGPPLKGPAFAAHWAGQSPEALLTYITTKMPPAGPGSLSSPTRAGPTPPPGPNRPGGPPRPRDSRPSTRSPSSPATRSIQRPSPGGKPSSTR